MFISSSPAGSTALLFGAFQKSPLQQPGHRRSGHRGMRSTYNDFGVVRLTNTGLTEAKEMHRYARAVVKKQRGESRCAAVVYPLSAVI